MSNKTEIQTLNAKYESLIEELRGKAAGGGSGGSVETCTVEWYEGSLLASVITNGTVDTIESEDSYIEGVVKGSLAVFTVPDGYAASENSLNGVTILQDLHPAYVIKIDDNAFLGCNIGDIPDW